MAFHFSFIYVICLGAIESIHCQNICSVNRRIVICCSNYYKKDGTCTACPPGYYGIDCLLPCPEGSYGMFCEKKCICGQNEVCNKAVGCLNNSTKVSTSEVIFLSWITQQESKLQTAISQTTEQLTTQIQTTESKSKRVPLYLYLFPLELAMIFYIVCSITIYSYLKNTTKEQRQNYKQRAEPKQAIPLRRVRNVNTEAAEPYYAEISDIEI